MYGTLALSHRALDDLIDVAGQDTIDELRRLARPLEGLRVLNLSVAGFGTGNAELLNSSVPLMSDLGLDVQWQVVRSSEEDLPVARAMYQALGGIHTEWTHEMTERWQRYASMNADLLTEPFDTIIVHDPEPLAMRSYTKTNTDTTWIAHSHIDLSSAQEDVWMLLRPHIARYDTAIFPSPSFTRGDIRLKTYIVPPAIDPNSARNMPLQDEVVRSVLHQYGIDPDRPMIAQISPCDPTSDFCGVVDAWDSMRGKHPELQLVMVLTAEPQDPASRACYDELASRCLEEPSAFVIAAGGELGNVELNVFQTAASVVIQRGLRKGFGLWIADALWKRRPCVVAPAPGLLEQVVDGETGLVASTAEEFGAAIERLLNEPEQAARLGENGRRHVAKHFLITRYLRDYLQILNEVHRIA